MMRWNKSKGEDRQGSQVPEAHDVQRSPASRSGVRPPMAEAQRKSLPQLLLEEGKVSREQLERLLKKQEETGAFLGELLAEEGLIEEQSLISFLAKYCKIPHLSLLDYLIDPDILEIVPKEVCIEYRLLPIDKLGSNLTVAMVNPLDIKALEKVRELCPTLRIKPILCAYKHFETVTSRVFGTGFKKSATDMSASSFGFRLPKPTSVRMNPEDTKPAPKVASSQEMQSAAVAEPGNAPQSVLKHADSDAIVDGVFKGASASDEPKSDTMSVIMEELTNVMMDSMRDTYDMLARRMELFSGLKPDDVAKIFARGDTLEVEEGQVIFERGQPGDNMYIILGGSVMIYDGDREIAKLERGDMFGEMALVSSEPRSASARATESSSLLALNIDVIRDVMPRDVSVQLLINIVITLSARLRHANRN